MIGILAKWAVYKCATISEGHKIESERPDNVIAGMEFGFLISIPWGSKLVWGITFS